jgi:hypothetical protein
MGTTAGISVSKELVMESFQSIPIDNPRNWHLQNKANVLTTRPM